MATGNEQRLQQIAEEVARLLNETAQLGGPVGMAAGALRCGPATIRRVGNRWAIATR